MGYGYTGARRKRKKNKKRPPSKTAIVVESNNYAYYKNTGTRLLVRRIPFYTAGKFNRGYDVLRPRTLYINLLYNTFSLFFFFYSKHRCVEKAFHVHRRRDVKNNYHHRIKSPSSYKRFVNSRSFHRKSA